MIERNKDMTFLLKKATDLKYIGNSYSWEALGNDPSFTIESETPILLKAGWYKWLLQIDSNIPNGLAKLYIDTGKGFSEYQTVNLPFESGEFASRYFLLDRDVLSMRFDPLEYAGFFSITQFEIEEINFDDIEDYFRGIAQDLINPNLAYGLLHTEVIYALYNDFLRVGQKQSYATKNLLSMLQRSLPDIKLYTRWYSERIIAKQEIISQKNEAEKLATRPLLSIVIPSYESNSAWFNELLHSLSVQSYRYWECIVVDDASLNLEHLDVFHRYANSDKRFRLIENSVNLGVGGSSKIGVEEAVGEYIAIVDHDDILEPNALYEIAKIVVKKEPAVIYSDEAMIDEQGNIIRCEFRPNFDYAMLLSHPYIVHLTFFRKDIIDSVGSFNESYTISQDYDLLLRVATKTKDFHHIPKILYKWRIHLTSTGHRKLKRVMKQSLKSLNAHLVSIGFKQSQAWIEEGMSFNFFRFRSRITPCKVTVIIPVRDQIELLKKCLETLWSNTELPVKVELSLIVVDNGSVEKASLDYFDLLSKQGVSILRFPGKFNFSAINNKAAKITNADYLLFLNNDIEIVEPDWFSSMLELMIFKDVGVVGSKLIYPNTGLIQHGGVTIGFSGTAAHDHQFYPEKANGHWFPGHLHTLFTIRECSAVTAACMLVRNKAFQVVGGFDENFAVGFGDADLCLRIRNAGWRCLFTPYSRLIHHESASRGYHDVDSHPKDTKLFKKRWREFIGKGDPYYNPNMSLKGELYYPAVKGSKLN